MFSLVFQILLQQQLQDLQLKKKIWLPDCQVPLWEHKRANRLFNEHSDDNNFDYKLAKTRIYSVSNNAVIQQVRSNVNKNNETSNQFFYI